jgi:CelD/BcsL family acetyltransferase involved in cellulose biosynthesis
MTVEWTSDPSAFSTQDWSALVESDPDGTFFHTPRYLKVYWEEFGATDLQIAVVREGPETLAAAAFDLRKGRLSFLGGTEVTDYMGPVGPVASRERAAKELMGAVAGRDDWRSADLRGLPEDGGWLGALAAGAGAAGVDVRVELDAVAPFLPLPSRFDRYLEALPSKRRHELRRKVRRLREALPDARLVDSTPEDLHQDLDTFVQLHRSSGGSKGTFMQPGMELFFRRLGEALISDGTFRLAFLDSGGHRLAGTVAFRDRDRLLLYNSAFDRAQAAISPGIVLVTELIRDSIEEGRRGLDMLKGNLRYKYQFGAAPRTICRLLLRRQ